jgi:hypothetical protein
MDKTRTKLRHPVKTLVKFTGVFIDYSRDRARSLT